MIELDPNLPQLPHIGPDGNYFRPMPGDQYILRALCPNKHGPLLQSPGWQRCAHCDFRTNITPAVTDGR